MHLSQIARYPVKSLSMETLTACELTPGQGLPHDRQWAFARPDGQAVRSPAWQSKAHFLVLVREYALAQINSHFDDNTGRLSLSAPGGLHAEGLLNTSAGRTAIAHAVAKHLGLGQDGVPTLVKAQDIGYFDTTKGPVSLLNMASLRAVENVAGVPLDPARFRMNLLVEDLEAGVETLWPGKHIQIGDAVLEITENTGRCKATHVNPETGVPDVKVLQALKKHFGHTQMGVYGVVRKGGPIYTGAPIRVLD